MESRKRSLPDEDSSSVSKKRALTGANGSPRANGDMDIDEEGFGEKLELFRKEAIFRRMKHYSRENERNLTRIHELEQRNKTCEAGVAAMSACWAQLVDTIRLIVKPDDLPQVDIDSKEIFDLTAHIQSGQTPELATALSDTFNATQALVTKFVQLGREGHSSLLSNESFSECQRTQDECNLLRSQVNFLHARLDDTESEKDKYYNALIAAESRFERSKSAIVREIESRKWSSDKEEEKDERSSPAESPVAMASPIQTNGFHEPVELELLKEQIKSRDNRIDELEREAVAFRELKGQLELEHKAPTLEQISESPYYKVRNEHASHLEGIISDKIEHIKRVENELQQIKESRKDWEDAAMSTLNQVLQDLRNTISKRDSENARLREARDQLQAELLERKAKDEIKLASLQEYKSLVDSNSERINILQSELSRCKAQLAANANAEDLMLFFLAGNIDEVRFFEAMRDQKIESENRVQALEETFAGYDKENSEVAKHIRGEVDAKQQLYKVTAELDKYQRTYGPLSTLPPDISQLAEQLRSKELELEKLRLLERQRQENESSLYVELEKLSTLWESLDRQLKSKVFDLAAMEDRLKRIQGDKAKSDNKYFASMRDRDSMEQERKNLLRTLEKQGKAVDKLTDAEKQLKNQLHAAEMEILLQKRYCEALKTKIMQLEKDLPELKASLEMDRKRVQEMTTLMHEREQILSTEMKKIRLKEDDFIRVKIDLEKQNNHLKKEVKLYSSAKSDPEDSELLAEMEKLRRIVMCTTCRETPRSTIITKCMHTFCKRCVDNRLATRQRKCPTCSIPFGQSDVHTFFFN